MTKFQLNDFPELLAIDPFLMKDPQLSRPVIKSRCYSTRLFTQVCAILDILKNLKKTLIFFNPTILIFLI